MNPIWKQPENSREYFNILMKIFVFNIILSIWLKKFSILDGFGYN